MYLLCVRALLITLPLITLAGCSPEVPKPQPCPYKNQSDCKEREILQMKSDLYLTVLDKYQDCLYSRYPMEKQNCGEKPQWKDFK